MYMGQPGRAKWARACSDPKRVFCMTSLITDAKAFGHAPKTWKPGAAGEGQMGPSLLGPEKHHRITSEGPFSPRSRSPPENRKMSPSLLGPEEHHRITSEVPFSPRSLRFVDQLLFSFCHRFSRTAFKTNEISTIRPPWGHPRRPLKS